LGIYGVLMLFYGSERWGIWNERSLDLKELMFWLQCDELPWP